MTTDADHDTGLQFDTDGFDLHAHRHYIEQGGCPYVEGKTWCNGRSDDLHQDHWAKYVAPDGHTRRVRLQTWRKRLVSHNDSSVSP